MALTPKKRGAPPPTGRAARANSGTLCTATRRDGQPCTNFAINGASVCRFHGGAAPQVRRAAQVRLLMASETAAGRLVAMIQDKTIPPGVQLAAIRDLLDRAGLAATQQIELHGEIQTWERTVDGAVVNWGELAQTPEGQRAMEAYNADIIDAEIVEDAPSLSEVDEHRARRLAEVERETAQLARRPQPTPPPQADDPRPPWEVDSPLAEERRRAREHRARVRDAARDTATPEGASRTSTGGLKPRTLRRR